MTELQDPKISMLINFDSTMIEIYDEVSSKTFVRVQLTNNQLASMLSRLQRTSCKVEVGDLTIIGKQMEHQTFEFEVDREIKGSNILLHLCCTQALEKSNMSDWIPEQRYNSQDSFFQKDGKLFARTIIRKWS